VTDANPLLDDAWAVPFDRITPAHVEPAVRARLAAAQEAVDAIKARHTAGDPLTFETVLQALDRSTEALERTWTLIDHLHSVRFSDALDAAHRAVQPEVTAFFSGLSLDPELYAVVRAYAQTDEAKALQGPQARYLDKTLEAFVRQGAELEGDDRTRFAQIQDQLAQLGSEFGANTVKATAAWSLTLDDEAQLAGLPETARGMLQQSAQAQGQDGWRVTLAAPSVIAVLTHADDRDLRETVWRAFSSRGYGEDFDNTGILARMVSLRRELAGLLGFSDFADYVLAPRMAGTGAEAQAFLDRLETRARPAFEREQAELEAFATAQGAPLPLMPWDLSYWAEKLRKDRFDFDEEALRPYLPFDRVLQGVFDLVQHLYGVTVSPDDLPVWHPTVRSYRITDAEGVHRGSFYVDFVPRDDKRQGAWMNALRTGGPTPDGGFEPHLGLICGNATPPVGDRPALLSHREVETVFHEFGHLVHHLLSTVPIKGQAGTNVAWDFVELPSQIMENWCWEKDGLDLFAAHWQTGETIPQDLFDKLSATRTFRQGSFFLRQLGFGQVDMKLHREFDPEAGIAAHTWGEELLRDYTPTDVPEGHGILPAFGHLFSGPVGYAAGYYSYMWAAQLDADAFSRFQQEGLFSDAVGHAFLDAILAKGDSAPPEELYRRFMGRDPDPEALLQRAGL